MGARRAGAGGGPASGSQRSAASPRLKPVPKLNRVRVPLQLFGFELLQRGLQLAVGTDKQLLAGNAVATGQAVDVLSDQGRNDGGGGLNQFGSHDVSL